jgi:hypothetical protein
MKIGTVTNFTNAAGTAAIPVASTATVYTPTFEINALEALGVQAKLTSDGDAKVLIQLEHCMASPTSEAADTSNAVIPDGFPDILDITDELVHIKQINPVPAKYARFKLTGQGTNDASTTCTLKIFRQEQT